MNNTINHNELLEDIDLYSKLIKKGSALPWLTPALFKTLLEQHDKKIVVLDKLTHPRKSFAEILAAKRASFNSQPRIATIKANRTGYKLDSEFTPCTCCLDIWRQLLRKLWNDYPEKREIMAASAKSFGYNRKYISSDRKNLFRGKTDWWIRKHSRELSDGWYMDVNVTPERIHKILPSVVSSAGLKWGEDITVIWD